jgi:bifunctional non-homologous end joining protein LigD
MAGQRAKAEHTSTHFIEPMLCLAVSDLPTGSEWEYELKLDGYRAIRLKTNGRVLLLSHNGKDLTGRFQPLARALEALPDETVIDGEVVALDEIGRRVRIEGLLTMYISTKNDKNTTPNSVVSCPFGRSKNAVVDQGAAMETVWSLPPSFPFHSREPLQHAAMR